MTFLVIGVLLVWQVYRSSAGQIPPLPTWRIALYLFAAVCCAVMAGVGFKERHRRQP